MSNKKSWRSFVISEQVKLNNLDDIFVLLDSDQRVRLVADLMMHLSDSEEQKLNAIIQAEKKQGELDLIYDENNSK